MPISAKWQKVPENIESRLGIGNRWESWKSWDFRINWLKMVDWKLNFARGDFRISSSSRRFEDQMAESCHHSGLISHLWIGNIFHPLSPNRWYLSQIMISYKPPWVQYIQRVMWTLYAALIVPFAWHLRVQTKSNWGLNISRIYIQNISRIYIQNISRELCEHYMLYW